MIKGYTDTLSVQAFFIFMAKFSYFVIFCPSVLARLWVKGTAMSIIIIITVTIIPILLLFLDHHLSSGPQPDLNAYVL